MNESPDNLEDRLKEARKGFNAQYNPKVPENKDLNTGARAGVELVGAVLGGALLGFLLDRMLGTSPALFIVFILLGVVTGFYNIYKIVTPPPQDLKQNKKDAKHSATNASEQ